MGWGGGGTGQRSSKTLYLLFCAEAIFFTTTYRFFTDRLLTLSIGRQYVRPLFSIYEHSSVYETFSLYLRSASRCGLALRRYAGKHKDFGSIRFGFPFSSKILVYRHSVLFKDFGL